MNNYDTGLIFKWLKSENASSIETKKLAKKTREAFNMTAREYRKLLSYGREKTRVLECLMSKNAWDKIDFSKIPSKAGIIYRNAFARRDILAKKYEAFAKDEKTKVNADALYPHDIAHRAFKSRRLNMDDPERLMLQKYWDNLKDFYQGREENGIAIVDVSGSMAGTPMEAAVSLGAYIAEKSHGPFANHFITFSANPKLVKFEGVDVVDKFNRCIGAEWGMNTNLKAVFDLLLKTAKRNNVKKEDIPKKLYIFSDMQFDACVTFEKYKSRESSYWWRSNTVDSIEEANSDLEKIKKEWENEGYPFPQVIFWNLNAHKNNIPAIGEGFSYVSGFSPILVDTILGGKDGYDLMIAKLIDSGRYDKVVA